MDEVGDVDGDGLDMLIMRGGYSGVDGVRYVNVRSSITNAAF